MEAKTNLIAAILVMLEKLNETQLRSVMIFTSHKLS